MNKPLAPSSIRITLDGNTVELRPTLRAAALIASGRGFRATYQGIVDGSLAIMAELIEFAGDHPQAVAHLVREIDQNGIVRLDALQAPLLSILVELIGADKDETEPTPSGKAPATQSIADYVTELFKIGCGVIGWTPSQTWSATPAEILAAHAGRVELIKAIFGSGDDKPAPTPETLDAKIKGVFAGFSTVKIERAA